jgi:hypothetical protein
MKAQSATTFRHRTPFTSPAPHAFSDNLTMRRRPCIARSASRATPPRSAHPGSHRRGEAGQRGGIRLPGLAGRHRPRPPHPTGARRRSQRPAEPVGAAGGVTEPQGRHRIPADPAGLPAQGGSERRAGSYRHRLDHGTGHPRPVVTSRPFTAPGRRPPRSRQLWQRHATGGSRRVTCRRRHTTSR